MVCSVYQKLQEILEQKEESQGAASSTASMSNNPEILTIDELSNATADSLTQVSTPLYVYCERTVI